MADSADNNQEEDGGTGILNSVKTIAALIKSLFSINTDTLPPIAKTEIKMGLNFRPGLSKTDIAIEIMDGKIPIGIPLGPLPSGAQNLDIAMEKLRVDTVVDNLLNKSKIEIIIPENQIVVVLNGVTSSGEAVTGTGTNSIPIVCVAKGGGIMR